MPHKPTLPDSCDVLVIGGGINGAGIARDAAGRGLSVVICERDDLAQHTSSASTKLVHGGLRYLEQYAFGLVRKALREREVLLRIAPHLISPLRFVLPHTRGSRPAWMIRAGLFLYDHLARRELLPASTSFKLANNPAGLPLKAGSGVAFAYSDAWVDDARLVVLNAMDAHEYGATVLTRTACTSLSPIAGGWRAELTGQFAGQIDARVVVNAAGPWAGAVASLAEQGAARRSVRMVKGSHIVVPRLFKHDQAYLFQHHDGRVVFAIPYQSDFTLVGTTDVAFTGDPRSVSIDAEETQYLCALANEHFRRQISPRDVVWSYSGVRPLLDDGAANPSAASRDYLLEWAPSKSPLLHVWGGKITTYRTLAEQAVNLIAERLGKSVGPWTAKSFLPGGDVVPQIDQVRSDSRARYVEQLRARYPWLPPALASRYAHSYGTRCHRLMGDAASVRDLGECVAPGLYMAELNYLVDHEWARCADDVLWRRTELGLRCGREDPERVEHAIAARLNESIPISS